MNRPLSLPVLALVLFLAPSSIEDTRGGDLFSQAPPCAAAGSCTVQEKDVEAQRLRKLFERRGPLQPETPYTLPQDTTAAHELNAMRLELQTLRAQLTRAGLPAPAPVQTPLSAIEDPQSPRLLQRIADRLEEPAMVVAPPLISASTGLPLAVSTLIVAILFAILKRDTNNLKKVDIKGAVTAAVQATDAKWDDRLLRIFGRFLPDGQGESPPPP